MIIEKAIKFFKELNYQYKDIIEVEHKPIERFKVSVKFKKINDLAIIPEYKTDGSVGFDFHSTEDMLVLPGGGCMIHTGLLVELPSGYEMTVRQRSGLSMSFPNYIAIGIGTIDWDYRGEIKIPIFNHHQFDEMRIKTGDRIAQGIISPVEKVKIIEVDVLSETERAEGGFGSTG